MKSKTKLAAMFKEDRKRATRGLSSQYDHMRTCQSYYNDENSSYSDTVQFADDTGRRRRAMVNFQKIQYSVDSIVGFLAQNRREAKFIARTNSDESRQIYSRNMNSLYSYHREQMNADQIESRQTLDMTVGGYGAVDTDLSYVQGNSTTDPNGQILKLRINPLHVYWDPSASSPNVMDSRFRGYYSDYDLEDALNLFQGSSEDDFQMVGDTEETGNTGFVYNPWGGLYDQIKASDSVEWADKALNRVRVYNHQWFEYETFYRAKNPLYDAMTPQDAMLIKLRLDIIKSQLKSDPMPDGLSSADEFDFDPLAEELTFDANTKALLIEDFGDQIEPLSFVRKCFYSMVISGTHVFTAFKSVSQRFSIDIQTGKYNERAKHWIGMVASMIEPQKYYNKSLTEYMFTIATNSKGGVMIEEDAVDDIEDFESKWAKTDAVITVRSQAISGGKIQEKARPAVPNGLDAILTLCDQSLQQNGVDPAFLGMANAQETGVLYKRRIRQVVSKMWWIADAQTLSQKEDARLNADLIRVWVENNAGQWLRITGPDGKDQFLQVSEDLMAPDYDVTISEGAESPEDQEETSQFISAIGDKYLSIQDNTKASALYAEAIDMLPLDGDVKARIKQVLTGQNNMVPMQQVQQLQQQLQALQSDMNKAQVQNLNSQTALNAQKIQESQANAQNKKANTLKTVEEAHQENITTQVIRKHSANATVTV